MKKNILTALLALLFSQPLLKCQPSTVINRDSILILLKQKPVSSERLPLYRQLAFSYLSQGEYENALIYYHEGLKQSSRIGNHYWITKHKLWLGGMHIMLANYDSAESYMNSVYPLLIELKNDSLLATYYQNKGTYFQFRNDYDKAAENTLKSIEILEKMGAMRPQNLLGQAYMTMSGILNGNGLMEKASYYDKKAISVLKDFRNPADYASIFYNACVTFNQLNDMANFKLYLDSANYYNHLYPSTRAALNILSGYGLYYDKKNQPDSAIKYYQQSVLLSKSDGETYFYAEQAINLAGILSKLNRNQEALMLLKDAVAKAAPFNDFQMLSEAYKGLKEIEKEKGSFQEALQYAELEKRYADSLNVENTNKTIIAAEAKYQNEKKENEIAVLTVKNKEKELTVIKRNRLLLIVGILSFSLILIMGLIIRSIRQKRLLAEKDKMLKDDQIRFLERQQQVVSLQSMINGQETERTRIARDLHDGLSGMFSTVKMYCSSLMHEKTDLQEHGIFKKTVEMIDQAADEIRRIAHNMMPEVLMKLGLVHAVNDLCGNISAGKLLTVKFQHYGMEQRLNAATEVMLYRILQELLNNIIKHARATEAIVQFNRDGDRLMVTVEDNGRGFDLLQGDGQTHAGLDTVKSRVDYLNGQLNIDSKHEIGTTVTMEFLIHEVV